MMNEVENLQSCTPRLSLPRPSLGFRAMPKAYVRSSPIPKPDPDPHSEDYRKKITDTLDYSTTHPTAPPGQTGDSPKVGSISGAVAQPRATLTVQLPRNLPSRSSVRSSGIIVAPTSLGSW